MVNTNLERIINEVWEDREAISPNTSGERRDAVEEVLDALDKGTFSYYKTPSNVKES